MAGTRGRQRRENRRTKARGTKWTFLTETGRRIVVSAKRRATYHDIEQALVHAGEAFATASTTTSRSPDGRSRITHIAFFSIQPFCLPRDPFGF